MSATPRPWAEHGKGGCECGQIFGPDGNAVIAVVQGPMHLGLDGPDCVPNREAQKANAVLIVRAVNAHDALVEALTWFAELTEEGFNAEGRSALERARAALALAEGKP